jgi:hypothetical protein
MIFRASAFRRRSLVAITVLACSLLALGAAQATAAGVLSSFTLTPAATQAGANPSVTADLTFSYANGTDSVETVTIALPPGLIASIANVPATCSPEQLNADACPAGAQIGTGTVTTNVTPRAAALYLMPPPSPGDAAGFGAVVLVGGDVYAGPGSLDVVTGVDGRPVGVVKLSVPVVSGQQVNALSATMNGTTDGKPFTRLPTSCSTATSSASVETVEGDTGSADDSFDPTGCSALGYAPSLSAVEVTDDPGGGGAELLLSISQPDAMAAAATKAVELDLPPSLVPNAGPAGACLTGTPCTIGTATATSPLMPDAYLSGGAVTLGGSGLAPTLTVAFPEPVALSIAGTADVATGVVTFPNVPDLPLTTLRVDITGAPGGKVLATTCAPGEVVARFTPHSGGAIVTDARPIAYRGCRSANPPPPPPPRPRAQLRVSIHSRRALVVRKRARVRLACRGAAGSACRGTLSLTRRTRGVRRVDGRRRVVHRKIVLARSPYALASGRTRAVGLRMTAAGMRLLERSRHRRLRVRATATVRGGTAARRAVVVRLRPTRRPSSKVTSTASR